MDLKMLDILRRCVLYKAPLDLLALEHNWDDNTLNKILDVLDELTKIIKSNQNVNGKTIENEFKKINISYNEVKGIINACKEEERYNDVVNQYLK